LSPYACLRSHLTVEKTLAYFAIHTESIGLIN
jgi:hypothetical protein